MGVLAGISVGTAVGSCVGADAAMAAATAALAQGRVGDAERQLANLAQSHPACAPALVLLAQVAAGRGEARQAEELFVRACEAAPGQPEPPFQFGIFYDSRQQHGRAAEQFQKVLALTPGDPQAYDYLALSLEALGQFKQAEQAYRLGLARNEGQRFDPMLHYNYGRFLMKRSRLDEAQRHLDQAAVLVPDVRAVHYERAKLAEKRGDLDRARRHGERALELADPQAVILDLQVYYLLSRVYRDLGDEGQAAKYTALSQKATVPLSARSRSGR